MPLPNDPVMLLSVVNTLLRDRYPSLDALCDDLQGGGGEITQSLSAIDCSYSRERNQFVRT